MPEFFQNPLGAGKAPSMPGPETGYNETNEPHLHDPNVQDLYILAGRLNAWADRIREQIEADLDSVDLRGVPTVATVAARADAAMTRINRSRYEGMTSCP